MTLSLDLDPSLTALLAIVGAVAGLLALVLGLVATFKVRGLRRSYSLLQSDGDAESFVQVVERKTEQVQQLQQEVQDTVKQVEALRVDLHDAIRHVAVVRYDAFNDMGGRMSFTAALLDDGGDGLVLTSINGRTETRTYAKGVKGGTSEAPLSPEEEQAVTYALRGPAS